MKPMQLLEVMNDIDCTMIENAQRIQKSPQKSFGKVLLVAALIASLTVTAFASKGFANWFQTYFTGISQAPLTESQITFLEENTVVNTQSQTCNGYTITLEAVITDGNHGYIKLHLTAPEGTALDASNYFPGNLEYYDCLQPAGGSEDVVTDNAEVHTVGMGWRTLDDNDGRDHTVALLCEIDGVIWDDREWKLHIKNIRATYYENPGTEDYRIWEETVAEGTWDFDVVFPQSVFEELELITEPVAGQVDIGLDKNRYENVKITSFKLRAMSAELSYEYLLPVHGAGDFETIYVVMKNGKRIELRDAAAYPGYCSFRTLEPIVLTDVDHVLLPNGTELMIP